MQRPDLSRSEIEELPDLAVEAEVRAYLSEVGPSLQPETLVFVVRDQRQRDQRAAMEDAMRHLVGQEVEPGVYTGGHCEGIIRNQARRFGCHEPLDRLDEFRGRCWIRICKGVLGEAPFWEERFRRAVKMRAIDVGSEMRRELDRHLSDGVSLTGSHGDNPEDDLLSGIERERLGGVLSQLPEQQRIALWLRYIKDLPIESVHEGDPTISQIMGVSSRMVRSHVRAAIAALRAHPEVLILLEDRQAPE